VQFGIVWCVYSKEVGGAGGGGWTAASRWLPGTWREMPKESGGLVDSALAVRGQGAGGSLPRGLALSVGTRRDKPIAPRCTQPHDPPIRHCEEGTDAAVHGQAINATRL
jgi:hypothetical protein